MIDGSVLQTVQRCFEKKSHVVVKMVVTQSTQSRLTTFISFGVASKTIKLTDFSLTFTAHHTIDTSQEVNLFYSILDKIHCIYFLGCCFSD